MQLTAHLTTHVSYSVNSSHVFLPV